MEATSQSVKTDIDCSVYSSQLRRRRFLWRELQEVERWVLLLVQRSPADCMVTYSSDMELLGRDMAASPHW